MKLTRGVGNFDTSDLQGGERPVGIYDRDLTYAETHLPVTEAKVRAALRNPKRRYQDMDALYFSLCNHPDFGMAHPLTQEVLDEAGNLVHKP